MGAKLHEKMVKASQTYQRAKKIAAENDSKKGYDQHILRLSSNLIDAYINNNDPKNEDDDIKKLLMDYYIQYPNKKPQSQFGYVSFDYLENENKTRKKLKEDMEEGNALREELDTRALDTELAQVDQGQVTQDQEVSDAAKGGMNEIADWMLRSCTKTGWFGAGKDQMVLVSGVLDYPPLIKLLAYYLIEKGLEKSGDHASISLAITEIFENGYKPNLATFKDKMIKSNWNVFSKFGQRFKWDKLRKAINIAEKYSDAISSFHSLQALKAGVTEEGPSPEVSEVSSDSSQTPVTQSESSRISSSPVTEQTENEADNETQTEPAQKGRTALNSDNTLAPLKQAVTEREKKLRKYVETGKDLIERSKNSPKRGKAYDAFVANSKQILNKAFEDLRQYDDNVENVFLSLLQERYKPKKAEDTTGRNTLDAIVYGSYGAQATKAPEKITSALNGISFGASWRLKDAAEATKGLWGAGTYIDMSGAVLGSFNVLYSAIRLSEDQNTKLQSLKEAEKAEFASSLSSAGESFINAAMGIFEVTGDALNVVAGVVGFITGFLKFTSAIAKLDDLDNNQGALDDAQKKVYAINSSESWKMRKPQKMINLSQRVINMKRRNAKCKVVSGGMQVVGGVLSATLIGASVGAGIAGVGSAIDIVAAGVKYYDKSKNIKQTIDDYLGVEGALRFAKEKSKDKNKFKESAIREQIRDYMMSTLLYDDNTGFFNDIITEYAIYLYNNIYFKDGKKLTSAEDSDPIALLILKSFSRFPDFTTGDPTLKSIEKSLKGE